MRYRQASVRAQCSNNESSGNLTQEQQAPKRLFTTSLLSPTRPIESSFRIIWLRQVVAFRDSSPYKYVSILPAPSPTSYAGNHGCAPCSGCFGLRFSLWPRQCRPGGERPDSRQGHTGYAQVGGRREASQPRSSLASQLKGVSSHLFLRAALGLLPRHRPSVRPLNFAATRYPASETLYRWYGAFQAGTPAQSFTVVFDTG